jgi:hypothetical protein
MAFLRLALLLSLIIISGLPAHGASARPRAGIGILVLRAFVPERIDELKALPIYAAPGIGRLAEIDGTLLPSLAPAVTPFAGESAVAVLDRRGDWLKVAYDDAGREGWIRCRSFWDFIPWRDFLAGRNARLLPGLREELTLMRPEPSDGSASLVRLTPDQAFRIVLLRDDWAKVATGGDADGWLRWRDGDGRLLLVVEAPVR